MTKLSRRTLLKSFAGGAALLPLLDAGRAKSASGFPKRLVLLQPTNGVLFEDFWPSVGSERQYTLKDPTSPLEPFREDLVFLEGVDLSIMLEKKPSYPGLGAWGGHEALPFLFTGAESAQGQYDGSVTIAIGNAMSLDEYVATELAKRASTPFKSLVLGGAYQDSKDHWRSCSFRGPAIGGVPKRPTDNPPEIDPRKVFDQLFGSLTGGGGTGDDDAAQSLLRARKKSVLDSVLDDCRALAARLGSDDKAKLEQHCEHVRALERQLAGLGPGAACVRPEAPNIGNPSDPFGLDKVMPANMDLIAAAFRCDLTRVAVVQMVSANNNPVGFPFLGEEFLEGASGDDAAGFNPGYRTHHQLTHNAGRSAEHRRQKNLADKWFVSQFAYLLAQLKATPEGDGTMLDNTVVLFANHMRNGAAHDIKGLPWIVAGNAGGAIDTGRALRASGIAHNRVLASLANAVLVDETYEPITGFGDPDYAGEYPGLRRG